MLPGVFSLHFLFDIQVQLTNSTHAELVRDEAIVPDTRDEDDDITQLVPSHGGDYICALTGQQVSNRVLYV